MSDLYDIEEADQEAAETAMSADETPDPRTVVIIGGVVYDGEEGL